MVGCGMKSKDLKRAIIKDLQKALVQNKKATLVVSGGSTPKSLFQSLRFYNLPWEKITITLCDERCVDPRSNDSNGKLVKKYLLKYRAKKGNFLPLYKPKQKINYQLKQKSKILKSLQKFDVVILGMGDDGHTASLFPNNPKLSYSFSTKKSLVAIKPDTAPYLRISLTKKALCNTNNIYLHTSGKKKKDVLQKAIKDGNSYNYPILEFLNHKLKVYQL